ncbi:MAG: gluconeogenesis factor YvcK family protein [Clostridia bacterium]|jgi:uncharacterized cofD-like protein
MNPMGFLKPGIKIKRWLILGLLGILLLGIGLSGVLIRLGFEPDSGLTAAAAIAGGALALYVALRRLVGLPPALGAVKGLSSGGQESNKRIIHKRILMRGPRVVVIGGGTGLAVLLRGLKNYTYNITAVVTVSDDGGGSGVLRDDLGMLPPGDIRNCILALADTEPVMEQLLQYRFKKGRLAGQSFGNLFIAAMNGISVNFEEAVKRISQVLAVTGQVLPITLEDTVLYAQLKKGIVVKGESNIPVKVLEHRSPIERVFIKPEHPEPLPEVLEAIENADAIVLGPGSLYTSIMPNLLAAGMVDCLYRAEAPKIYVCNIMTQPGETDGFSAADHIRALEEHAGRKILDMVIVNSGNIEEAYLERYAGDGAKPVEIDGERIRPGVKVISADLVSAQGEYLRHDSMGLGRLIAKLISGKGSGLMEYYYHLIDMTQKQK